MPLPPPTPPLRSIWIDTDLALGSWRGDVDDGWAIAAIARGASHGAHLLGLSTVSGNASATTAARCAAPLLAACAVSIPIVPGASRPGQLTAAAEALCALPAGTHVLAIGPLTNVAAAVSRDPSLAARITVHIVGGNLTSRGRFPPIWPNEFNLAIDPEAARTVFAAPMRRRLYPLDECCRLTVSVSDMVSLSRASPLGAWLARRSWRWLLASPLRLRALRFPVWDLVPALDLLGALGARTELHRLSIRGRGLLVRDGAAGQTEVVRGLDRDVACAALDAFVTIISAGV